jgi:hypothetical protein
MEEDYLVPFFEPLNGQRPLFEALNSPSPKNFIFPVRGDEEVMI